MVTIKEFVDIAGKSELKLPKNKRDVLYFLDKTIIDSWLKKPGTVNDSYTKIFMDLLYYVRGLTKESSTIIPVDVLLELKKDGNKEILKKTFKKWILCLAKIMEVDPNIILSHNEAIIKISEQYNKQGYKCCIITLNQELYKQLDKSKIFVITPTEIILTLVIYYCVSTTQFKKIIDEWLSEE